MPEPPTESLGQTQSVRRSVTLPTKLNPQAQRGSGAPNLGENVIFYHPTAKIVHFAPRALVPIPSGSAPTDFDYPVDTIETLPWRSATERTVATAPLKLEKVHGLTVFLKCGNVVHAILKNSQCWCVDGVSKFVLRIRPLTYYRIELPHDTEHDKGLVDDLQAVLPTVLRYEVTPCPFKRAFTVEIPEDAMAPRRKRAWKPKGRTESIVTHPDNMRSSSSDSKSERRHSTSIEDDTDGATTDDSGLGAERANITAPETISTEDQSPASINTIELSVHLKPGRRSVTEPPQTFDSLRAKFDASPAPERVMITEGLVRETETSTEDQQSKISSEASVADDTPDKESAATQERHVSEVSTSENGTYPEGPASMETRTPRISVDEVERQPEIVPPVTDQAPALGTLASSRVPTATEQEESMTPEELIREGSNQEHTSAGVSSPRDLDISPRIHSTTPDIPISEDFPPVTTSASATRVPSFADTATISENVAEEDHAGSESDLDHDTSFSSSPGSFHSADLSSRSGSVSTHTLSEDTRDTAQQTQTPRGRSVPLSEEAAKSDSAETLSQPLASTSHIHGISNSDGTPVTPSKFAYYETHVNPSKPSLTIPSDSRRHPQPGAKASSPTTDFNRMSTEFRRRAQATRQREVSPMPPPSALYQPSPGDETTSILSKALALVLVPPVSLFIILLHITARIIISPALGSSTGQVGKGSHTFTPEDVTEDDFSYPLEREASSDYEDAEITRKLDPWDLD